MTLVHEGQERALATTEAACAESGVPVVVTYTLHGPLHLDALRESVRALHEHHDVLRARLASSPHGPLLRCEPTYEPPELITNTDFHQATALFPKEGSVFRPSVVRNSDQSHTVFLAVHHAISDGASVLALHELLWRIYTATTNATPPPTTPGTRGLPEPVEDLLRGTYSQEDLNRFRSENFSPEPTATIPHHAVGDESGVHCRRIEIPPRRAALITQRARSSGLGTNAFLFGALTVAARRCITSIRSPLPMTFTTPVDLRPHLNPPLPQDHMVFAAAPAYTSLSVASDTPPENVARDIWRQLRSAISRQTPQREFAAFPRLWKRAAAQNSALIASSLLGRCNPLTLPTGTTASPPSFPVETPITYPAIGIGEASNGVISLDVMQPRRYFTAEQADQLTEEIENTLSA
ncbi:hypothetical protein E1181_28500 [Saccharopolyspora terrae]|uniref:Phthiocerol/phthiodiolone dimycocerosyl transferase n=1 Tax=Saccharopolyspora terrae TaxID=2530384 RepID=A0A4R4V499_9PSEU|nr:condensation domain-containing protein [Saccharopolyspora terrae]TDC99947.1 hypothetical protein E1181_28500 [Saccharopolyspora terrae]